jgi:hypothetical protein
MNLLDLDKRWQRFNDPTRVCPCCGETLSGVFDIGFDHPDAWPHGPRLDVSGTDLTVGDDKLSADLCRLGEDRFIRCVLPLPIRGSDEVFYFGVWASVDHDSFYAYLDASLGDGPAFKECFSWLQNDLPVVGPEGSVPCDLAPGAEGERPHLMAQSDSPLAARQADGISFDTLLDIYAASGQDMRPHLMQD